MREWKFVRTHSHIQDYVSLDNRIVRLLVNSKTPFISEWTVLLINFIVFDLEMACVCMPNGSCQITDLKRRHRSASSPACICLRKRNPWLRTGSRMFPRKEVIQPHLPVRLPCYDFTPVTNPALGRCFQMVSSRTSGVVDFHGVTGGVYKTRERIQRSVLICVY